MCNQIHFIKILYPLFLFYLISSSVALQAIEDDSFNQISKIESTQETKDLQLGIQDDAEKEILKHQNLSINQNESINMNYILNSSTSLIVNCTDNSECNDKQICNNTGHCQRNDIMPLSFPEILGSLLIIIILGFGQAAGVGGGTSIMPLLLLLFQYDSKKSVAIVIVLVFSGSLGNVIQLSRDRTNEGVPVIDYRLILVTLPSLIVGTIYGVATNKFLPPILVCLLLVGLLLQQIQKTYNRYKITRDKEISLQEINSILHKQAEQLNTDHQDKIHQDLQQQIDQNQQTKLIKDHTIAHFSKKQQLMIPLLTMNSPNNKSVMNDQSNEQFNELIMQEKQLFPKKTLSQIAAISISVIFFSLIRGGSKFSSLIGVPPCGLLYQSMNLLLAFCLYKWIIHIIDSYQHEEKFKADLGYTFPHGKLTREAMKKYAETGFIAGFIGGMLGIGGGIILIPRWIEYGISTTRTTACTLSIVCFTTFNSFLQLYLSGSYNLEEIVFFSSLALVSSLICRAIKAYVKKTHKDSLLILILVIFMIMASTLLSGIIIYHAFENFEDSTKFGNFC